MLVRTDRSVIGFTPPKIGKVKSTIIEREQETPLVCLYCRRFCLLKSRAIIPVYKGKASTGLYVGCKVRRLRRFPINLPLASLRAYLSGKPCIRPPHAKEPLKTETTAPPPTEGKNNKESRAGADGVTAGTFRDVRYSRQSGYGRRRQSPRSVEARRYGQTADTPHGYLRRKYHSLLGNFQSRNTSYR